MSDEKGFCLWFTGLSGSGKSTITTHLVKELRKRGSKLEVLDGDVVRENLSKGSASRRRTATRTSAGSPSSPTCSRATRSR